jgi:tRNA A37 methylthiotransferase MiaB
MPTNARLRRHPGLVIEALEAGTWGLFNPQRHGALFVDRLGLSLLEAVDSLGDPEAVVALAREAGQKRADVDVEALARARLAALTRFGALVADVPRGPARVLLVDPPCAVELSGMPGPNKGLCTLAALLEAEAGLYARVLDLRSMAGTLGPERSAQAAYFARYLATEQPDVVGFTAVSATIENASLLVTLTRLLSPAVFLVLGGPHASYEWRALLEALPALDAVVLGEGEVSFPQLVQRALAGARQFPDVMGVAFRDDHGRPVSTGWSPSMQQLDSLPVRRDSTLLANAADYERRGARVLTARGCTFQCSFCSTASFTGRRIRTRSVARVVAEMEDLFRNEGITTFSFDDDIFTFDRGRTLALCAALRAACFAGQATWGCNTRLDCIDEALIDALAEAGCRHVLFGVESGDPGIQGRFGKGARSLHRFREKITYLAERGIEAQLNFILGLPGENRATLDALVQLLRGLPASVTYAFNFLNVFPGTPLERQFEALGLRFLDETPAARFNLTAPTVATPTLDAAAQIDAYLRLRYLCETGRDTLSQRMPTARPDTRGAQDLAVVSC